MSNEGIVLKHIAPRAVAYLRCKGPWRQLPEMLAKLDEHMASKGLKPIGPASGVYYNTPGEVDIQELAWEVYYRIAPETPESAEDGSGFGIKKIAGASMATIVHRGAYRHAGPAYERLEDWIHSQRLKLCGHAEEVYFSGIVGSPEKQEIEIRLPVCPL